MTLHWTYHSTSDLKFYHVPFANLFVWMLLKTVFRADSQERDSGETAVDVEAARLVAQKLGENGIGGNFLSFHGCDFEVLDMVVSIKKCRNIFRDGHPTSSECKGSGAGPRGGGGRGRGGEGERGGGGGEGKEGKGGSQQLVRP